MTVEVPTTMMEAHTMVTVAAPMSKEAMAVPTMERVVALIMMPVLITVTVPAPL